MVFGFKVELGWGADVLEDDVVVFAACGCAFHNIGDEVLEAFNFCFGVFLRGFGVFDLLLEGVGAFE